MSASSSGGRPPLSPSDKKRIRSPSPSGYSKGGKGGRVLLLPSGVKPAIGHELQAVWAKNMANPDLVPGFQPTKDFIDRKALEHRTAASGDKHERKLSGKLCVLLSEHLRSTSRYALIHQAPTIGDCVADFAVTTVDAGDDRYYAFGEAKWEQVPDEFPECQLAAYALQSGFRDQSVMWFPAFVISSMHVAMGITFRCGVLQKEWAYSPFAEEKLSAQALAALIKTLHAAVEEHKNTSGNKKHTLLTGASVIQVPLQASFACRRLYRTTTECGRDVAVKFYASKSLAQGCADIAQLCSPALEAKVIAVDNGCALLVTNWIDDKGPTPLGLARLVLAVQKLHQKGFAHGDLRLPNMAFTEAEDCVLLDFDWSGPEYSKKFPSTLNRSKFPPSVLPEAAISKKSDIEILQDLFRQLGLDVPKNVIRLPRADDVERAFAQACPRPFDLGVPTFLDQPFLLGELDKRIETFEATSPG